MSVHAQGIAVDGLLLTYGPLEKKAMMFLNPNRDMRGNIIKIRYSEMTETPTATHNAQKFLDSWAAAIKHSKLDHNSKKIEIEQVETIQYELFWAWDWADDEMLRPF